MGDTHPTDTRFCYGAACTWCGPIQEVSDTKRHPFWKGRLPLQVKVGDRVIEGSQFATPCCPHCGGMLLEVEAPAIWWDGVDAYEQGIHPTDPTYNKKHPGYRAMWNWQINAKTCFKNMETLAKAYHAATGILVDNIR